MSSPTRLNQAQFPLLELDLLKTLVAIAEAGNFSAAAEVVHRTPSAISIQVKRIEDMVGQTVFIRDSRSVVLTPEGEQLLAHARRVLALNREILTRFMTHTVSGVVRLGALDHAAEQFLPELLRHFAETHPGIAVDVTVENSNELLKKIRQNQLDIAIVACDSDVLRRSGIEILMLEALVWAGAKGGIAAERKPLPVSVWEEDCVWRKLAVAGLEKQGRDYRVTFKSAHIAGQKAAVIADMAVAPLPLSSCTGSVAVLGSEGDLPALSDFAIGMSILSEPSEPVNSLADHLRTSLSIHRAH